MKIPSLAIGMSMLVLTTSCSGHASTPDADTFIRADSLVAAFASGDSATRAEVRARMTPAINALAATGITGGTKDSDIVKYAEGRAFTFFAPAVRERFTAGDSLAAVLESEKAAFARELPSLRWPKVYGIISPYNQSVVTTDSVALIALNHYLGRDYEAYSVFEPYVRRRKEARLMPYHLAEALVARHSPMEADSTTTLLAHMLHDGAVAEALMRTVPSAQLSDAGGWTPEELAWLQANEAGMWKELSSLDLLDSTSPLDISRMLTPGPATMALSLQAPGAAGRYLGWRLVHNYLATHPEASLEEVLRPEFYLRAKVVDTPEDGFKIML